MVRRFEQAVQLGEGGFTGTEQLHQAVHVVRDQPDVLPAGSFGVVGRLVAGVDWVEGFGEGTVDLAAAHELKLGIPVMAVGAAPVAIDGRYRVVAQEGGGVGQGSVGDGVFHVVGHRLGVQVGRDETVFHPKVLAAVVPGGGHRHRIDHLILREPGVKSLDDVVGEGDESRIAHHAVGLIAHQVPHGQFALLLKDVQESLSDIPLLLAMDERLQRMRGTVGVPKG